MKILCISLGALLIISTTLCIYFAINLATRKVICEQPILSEDRNRVDAVPDEITAGKIADAIIETHKPVTALKNELGYTIEIVFNEGNNEWEVKYFPIPPEGVDFVGGGAVVRIKKDCGMITYIEFSK